MKKTTFFVFLALFFIGCGSDAPKNETTEPAPLVKEEIETSTTPIPKDTVVAVESKAKNPIAREKKDDNITGIFKYMADAAIFRDCASGERMSVAMEQDYLNLERTYLKTVDGGTPVLIRVEGSYEMRNTMKGKKKEKVLVVKQLRSLEKDKDCPG